MPTKSNGGNSPKPAGRIALQPVTAADLRRGNNGTLSVTLDRFGRLRLGSATTQLFGIYGVSAKVYVSVDPAQRIVALRKYDEVTKVAGGARVFSVDKRGYISARWLYDKFALRQPDGPYVFASIGDVDEAGVRWHAFRLAK